MKPSALVRYGIILLSALSVVVCLIYPQKTVKADTSEEIEENRQVWIEYLASWGNPVVDEHWNRWEYKSSRDMRAPDSIPSSLYPELGLYSSHDVFIVENHMRTIRKMGIDAVLCHWWSRSGSDPNELHGSGFSDKSVPIILDAAYKAGVKVAIHIQTCANIMNLEEDVNYIAQNYINHSAYLRIEEKPVILLSNTQKKSLIHNIVDSATHFPFYFIATIDDYRHLLLSYEDGFNALMPSHPSDGHTWAANSTNWNAIKNWCAKRGVSFIPRISPGYDESLTNMWSRSSVRSRSNGEYYREMWRKAIDLGTKVIVINSFNNWIDGTAIEPAVERENHTFTSSNWSDERKDPTFYLEITKQYISQFKSSIVD